MRSRNQFRPSLESLEARWCPATVKLIGGNLFVSDQQGELDLIVKAGNKINVVDDVTDVTLPAPTALFVTGTNGKDVITLDLNALTYAGNVLINSRGGSDLIFVGTSASTGTLTGNITILSGSGADVVSLNSLTDGDVDFKGNITAVDSGGTDAIGVGEAFVSGNLTTVSGNVSLTGYNLVGLSFSANADVLAGNVTVTQTDSAGSLVITGTDLRIAGNLTVTGASGDDTVALLNADQPGFEAVGGNINVNLANGENALFLTPIVGTQTLGGNVNYNGGGDEDAITIDADVVIDGNATFNMGEGDNDYAGLASNFTVDGNLRIMAGSGIDDLTGFGGMIDGDFQANLGNGTNTLTFGAGASLGSSLAYTGGNGKNTLDLTGIDVLGGGVSFKVGNGNKNSFTTDGAIGGDVAIATGNGNNNVATFNDGATVGGKLMYRGGNGTNKLNILSDDALFNLDVHFGNGNDSLAFGGVAASVTGFADGGGGVNKLQGAGAVTFVAPFTILNFV